MSPALKHLETEVKKWITYIHVHHVGIEYKTTSVADTHGMESPQFRLTMAQHMKQYSEHSAQLEVLEWILGEIYAQEGKNKPKTD